MSDAMRFGQRRAHTADIHAPTVQDLFHDGVEIAVALHIL